MKNTTTSKKGSGEDHLLFLDVVTSMRLLVSGGRIRPAGWYKFYAAMLTSTTKSYVSEQCSMGPTEIKPGPCICDTKPFNNQPHNA